MNTVKLYRITTTYNTSFNDYWSLVPASNEIHPSGLSFDEYTDGGAVEFELPEGLEVASSVLGDPAIYDADGYRVGLSDACNGEPMLSVLGGFDCVVLKRV